MQNLNIYQGNKIILKEGRASYEIKFLNKGDEMYIKIKKPLKKLDIGKLFKVNDFYIKVWVETYKEVIQPRSHTIQTHSDDPIERMARYAREDVKKWRKEHPEFEKLEKELKEVSGRYGPAYP